jgi:hypothetical protein
MKSVWELLRMGAKGPRRNLKISAIPEAATTLPSGFDNPPAVA